MANLLNYYRGLIIVDPYGTYIRNRQKNMIVKSKIIKSIIEEDLLLIENKKGLGIRLGVPKKINLKEFSKLKKYHKISSQANPARGGIAINIYMPIQSLKLIYWIITVII